SSQPPLTKKEEAIMEALRTPIPVDFKKARFEDVMDHLEKQSGVHFLFDKGTLEQAGVSYDSTISMSARGVSLRTVLKKVLGELNLAYVLKDETIQVVTREEAKRMLVARTYSIADLVTAVDMRWGPIITQYMIMQNINQLMAMITSTIEPQS